MSLFLAFLLYLPLIALFAPKEAMAVGTAAGTVIGNQATATYEDGSNNSYISTSNLVTTTVLAKYGISITPDGTDGAPGQTQSATPGSIVYFAYTITNTGNASDSYDLQTVLSGTDDFSPVNGSVKIYWDKNGNGSIDTGDQLLGTSGADAEVSYAENTTNIGPIAADASAKIVVQYTIPSSGLSNGDEVRMDLQGTSAGDNGETDVDNYNQTTIVNDAVITITKGVDNATIDPSGVLTYTFTINNTGNQTATDIMIDDAIPSLTKFKMTANGSTTPEVTMPGGVTVEYSNDSGATWTYVPGDDDDSTANNGVDDDVDNIRFTIASLAAANSRTITFKVKVDADAPATTIPNFADTSYDPVGPVVTGTTNTVTTTVNTKSAVLISPLAYDADDANAFSTAPNYAYDSTASTTEATSTDASIASAAVPVGTYYYFRNTVSNNGNATDRFNIQLDGSSNLPSGSTVLFYTQSDTAIAANNTSQLLDTNGDSIPDTGAVVKDGSVTIIARVWVPGNADNTGAPYNAVVKATSTNGGTALGTGAGNTLTDTTRDRIASVAVPDVDITNIIDGVADNNTVSFMTSADGTTVTYPLNVENQGSSSDTFNLSATGGPSGATILFYSTSFVTTIDDSDMADLTEIDLASVGTLSAGDTIVINGQALTIASISGSTVTFASGQSLYTAPSDGSTVARVGTLPITSTGVLTAFGTAGDNINIVGVVTVPAGTSPGTYANVQFTTTSNNDGDITDSITDTLVVDSYRTFTLVANRSGSAPAGGVLFYEHTLTNTGNDDEEFTLALSSASFGYQLLDGTTNDPITGPITLNAGDPGYNFKVKVTVPSGTAAGTTDNVTVTATETNTSATASNIDQTTVVSGFIQLIKSVDKATAEPGETLTYTIQYTNIGSINATKVKIVDLIPANTTFVAGSLRIAATLGTLAAGTKTDGGGAGDADTGTFANHNVSTANAVTFFVGTGAAYNQGGTVAPAETGYVRFQVQVN